MTAQQLRNSILQQAIQGRLVPQDPNDEPASVLLERIRKEKEQLVKEGKLKKKDLATTPIADDEKPFDIPSGWEWCRLDFICKYIEDCPHTTAPDEGHGFPLVRTPNIGFGKLLLKGVHRVSKSVYDLRNSRAVPMPGDLIYAREAPAGNVAVIEDGEMVCLGQRTVLISPFIELINSKCLAYFILSPLVFQKLVGQSTGTTVAHVNLSDIRPLVIPLPPLAEQRRIVAKIEELMPLVEKYGKAQTELDTLNQDLPRRLRQSVLQQAIQGKLVEQDEKDEWSNIFVSKLPKKKYKTNAEWPCEEPFDLPSGWNWCHIGDVCEILNGYAFKSGNYVDSGIRIMRISNVQAGVIVDKDPKFYPLSSEADIKDYVLKEGDMLMSLTGNVGRVGILKADMLPAALNQRVACLRLHNEEIKPFFYHYLQSEIFRMRCESSGHGMAQLNISTEWLKQELIPLPPLAEQRRIVAKIEELFAEIDKLK